MQRQIVEGERHEHGGERPPEPLRHARGADTPFSVYVNFRKPKQLTGREALFGAGEMDIRPTHPLISHVIVPPIDRVYLDGIELLDDSRLRYELRRLCVMRPTPAGEPVTVGNGDAH